MKGPMTTEVFFRKICEILREKDGMPDILDYALPTHHPMPMTTYAFVFRNDLDYGGSEGIYLTIWIEMEAASEKKRKRRYQIGVFKTLETGQKAMRIMSSLLADFIVEGYSYVNSHLDDFSWEGFDIRAVDETGRKLGWSYTCRSKEQAMFRTKELLESYPCVSVRDNATRTELLESRHTEIAYQFEKGYFSIQKTSDGYDYSFYDQDGYLLDGGVYDNSDVSIERAVEDIFSDAQIDRKSCREVDYEMLIEKEERIEQQRLEARLQDEKIRGL